MSTMALWGTYAALKLKLTGMIMISGVLQLTQLMTITALLISWINLYFLNPSYYHLDVLAKDMSASYKPEHAHTGPGPTPSYFFISTDPLQPEGASWTFWLRWNGRVGSVVHTYIDLRGSKYY